jgi:hypothetical protein
MITWASVFLSHNSDDKPLVEAVAAELGRRGIFAWLDKKDLIRGGTLTVKLDEAVRAQTVVAAFLSEKSVGSKWVTDELEIAFEVERTAQAENFVAPICLSDPMTLIEPHNLLRTRLLHKDGDRVNRLCIVPEKDAPIPAQAAHIAEELAKVIFDRLHVRERREVLIYLDQRGDGRRASTPGEIPDNLKNDVDIVGLVFSPDLLHRNQDATLTGNDWEENKHALLAGLGEALGSPVWIDPKKIRTIGNAQSALFFMLGQHFNRNTSARLYCYNRAQGPFSNPEHTADGMPLTGGNAHCETKYLGFTPLAANAQAAELSLYLGTDEYLDLVLAYRQAAGDVTPLYWVESSRFASSLEAMNYVKDVIALLKRLRKEHGVRSTRLYNTLPIHVVPLLAANWLHVGNVVLMEFRRDLRGKNPPTSETYTPLQF